MATILGVVIVAELNVDDSGIVQGGTVMALAK